MDKRCIQRVNDAAGRTLSAGQIQAIEDRISSTMRELARRDPERWRGLTQDQRISEAAAQAQADIQAEAVRRLENVERQVVKAAETENRITSIQSATKASTRTAALKRDLINTEGYVQAIRRELDGSLMDTIAAAESSKGRPIGARALQLVFGTDNPLMTRDIVREVFAQADGHTGNPIAQAGARAWLDTIEGARRRFNAAGGDVGQLDYGYVPQPWSTTSIRKVGAERFADDVLPHLDRRQYLRADGSQMDDAEVRAFLEKSWQTLATEGLNKADPGAFRGAKRANRGSDHRQIHFRDGEAWLAVMGKYGSGSLYDAMRGHVGRLARDIGLVERYGPDPSGTARVQFDMAELADGKPGALEIRPQTYFDMVSGATGTPVSERIANVGIALRSVQVAGKLGAAVLSSITDLGTLAITAGYNRLPYFELVRNIGRQANRETREWMAVHGMIADSIANSLDRWSADNLAQHWSGKLANATMRLSLLNAWTSGLRQGFKLTLAANMARMAKTPWSELAGFDRARLQRSGITAEDWAKLNAVRPEVFRGREVLTPQAIKAAGSDDLAARLFGFIHDESEFAVIEPDLTTRAITTMGGQQAGTYGGEIARTAMQFKSFPIAMITRHWGRLLEGDFGEDGAPLLANRVLYGSALLVSGMALGAVSEQAHQAARGHDPVDVEKHPKFWVKATLRGGGLGIAGDMLLMDTTAERSTQEALGRMALGPTFGTLADAWELTKGNMDEHLLGKDTHAAAEALRLGQSLTPVANVWWIKPMVDHSFMHALQESLSPGYLARVKRRAEKDWGGQYWWAPGTGLPQRAPEFVE